MNILTSIKLPTLVLSINLICASTSFADPAKPVEKLPPISVAEETLWAAKAVKFDYTAALKAAQTGDVKAIETLLMFNETDAAASLGHGVALVELGNQVGDKLYAEIISALPIESRKGIKNYLDAGAAYATDPKHKRPIAEQFPLSTKALAAVKKANTKEEPKK